MSLRHIAALLLFSLPLLAGERPIVGHASMLGDVSLSPFSSWRGYPTEVSIATDGDETLLVWVTRGSVFAQRLDRNGAAVTETPAVLVRGAQPSPPYADQRVRAVHASGGYVVFYAMLGENYRWTLRAMRLTRQLERIDDRELVNESAAIGDAVAAGNEILLTAGRTLFRLRPDLSVIDTDPFDATTLVPAPHGTLALTNQLPALSARMLDGAASVRLATAYQPASAQGVWTGSHYVVVWADYGWVYATTLDRDLRPSKTITLDSKSTCESGTCLLSAAAISADEAIVSWASQSQTMAVRVRNGAVVDSTPFALGVHAKLHRTAAGRFLTVDGSLKVRVFDLPPASSPATLTPVATVRTAAYETLAGVAWTSTEVAVARHRADDTNIVSILDRDGRTLREVSIRSGRRVSIASDGTDFYALISGSYSKSHFQKVAAGAPVAELPANVVDALEWGGTGFLILQSGYADYTNQVQYRTRGLWVTREGKVELLPCPMWEFPQTIESAHMMRAGDDVHVIAGKYTTSLRRDCLFMPLDEIGP